MQYTITINEIGFIADFIERVEQKHGVKKGGINIHCENGCLYIQEYTPGSLDEFKLLEMHDLNKINHK